MGFKEHYEAFLNEHLSAREGESHRRLKEGHGEAEKLFLEKVWWPLFHHFRYLHPEFEIDDYKDGKRYLDFAYMRPGVRVCFEIDGYGPHLKNITRWQFGDQLERQNHLILNGWIVIRFSYDQVVERPMNCQQITELAINRSMGNEHDHISLDHLEKEVIRIALEKEGRITPVDLYSLMDICDKTARKVLARLVQKSVLLPAGSGKNRIRSYQLVEGFRSPFASRIRE